MPGVYPSFEQLCTYVWWFSPRGQAWHRALRTDGYRSDRGSLSRRRKRASANGRGRWQAMIWRNWLGPPRQPHLHHQERAAQGERSQRCPLRLFHGPRPRCRKSRWTNCGHGRRSNRIAIAAGFRRPSTLVSAATADPQVIDRRIDSAMNADASHYFCMRGGGVLTPHD